MNTLEIPVWLAVLTLPILAGLILTLVGAGLTLLIKGLFRSEISGWLLLALSLVICPITAGAPWPILLETYGSLTTWPKLVSLVVGFVAGFYATLLGVMVIPAVVALSREAETRKLNHEPALRH